MRLIPRRELAQMLKGRSENIAYVRETVHRRGKKLVFQRAYRCSSFGSLMPPLIIWPLSRSWRDFSQSLAEAAARGVRA